MMWAGLRALADRNRSAQMLLALVCSPLIADARFMPSLCGVLVPSLSVGTTLTACFNTAP
jgi:hypothetical protein